MGGGRKDERQGGSRTSEGGRRGMGDGVGGEGKCRIKEEVCKGAGEDGVGKSPLNSIGTSSPVLTKPH